MCRRSSSGWRLRTSSPPMRISPEVGSTSRLIIFIVVVLPHPDGPTKTTSSPAGMSRVTLSTAGAGCPGYCLVSPRNSMRTPAESRSNTKPPRGGELTDCEEERVEKHRDDDDAERSGERGVQ